MLISVPDGNDSIGGHLQSRFFLYFFYGIFFYRYIDIGPAPPGKDHFLFFSCARSIFPFSKIAALVSNFGV